MKYPLYIALDLPSYPVFAASNHEPLKPLLVTLRETLRLSVAFGRAGVMESISGSTGRLVIKAPNAPDGAVMLLDSAWVASGSGADTRYDFEVLVDSADLRAYLGSLIDRVLSAQIEWTVSSEIFITKTFLILVANAVARNDDQIPDPAFDAAFARISSVLVAGDNVTLDADSAARTITVISAITGSSAGDDGWSPLIRTAADGTRIVFEVYDWTGGSGDKPATGYISSSGLTSTIGSATNVRGSQGLTGIQGLTGLQGIQGEQGETGPSGGPPGEKGDTGNTGPQGDTGPQGPQGEPGAAGADGADGAAFPAFNIIDLSVDGNDGTGEPGNPAKPYRSIQAAYNAYLPLLGPAVVIRMMPGDYGTLTLSADMSPSSLPLTIIGCGYLPCFFSIVATGTAGAAWDGLGSPGTRDGGKGYNLRLVSNGSVRIVSLNANGGAGGAVTDPSDIGGLTAGNGGEGGEVNLRGFYIESFSASGGNGGNATGTGSTGGNGGVPGTVKLIDCEVGTVAISRGTGGTGVAANGTNGASTGTLETWQTAIGTVTINGTATHHNALVKPDAV